MLLYASLVWWQRTTKDVGIRCLDRLQRLALRLITSCFKTTPTRAMEVLLDLRPLHMAVVEEAMSAWVRLRRNNLFIPGQGHGTIAHQEWRDGEHVICMNEDICTTTFSFENKFQVTIMDNAHEAAEQEGHLVCYTDGSLLRLPGGTASGYGAWIAEIDHRISQSSGAFCSIFQAEILAIIAVATTLLARRISDRDIFILSDSQAALRALEAVGVRSKLVGECKRLLNELGSRNTINLMWVRGHAGTHGNEEADTLAREGAGLRFHGPEPAVGVPPVLVRNAIREKAKVNHRILWQQTLSCRQCKEFGVDLETKRAKGLVRLSRQNIRASICLLTGHGGFGKHLHRMGLATSPTCPHCGLVDETAKHLLCECDALHHIRMQTTGLRYLDPAAISGICLTDLLNFLRESGRWQQISA